MKDYGYIQGRPCKFFMLKTLAVVTFAGTMLCHIQLERGLASFEEIDITLQQIVFLRAPNQHDT